MQYLQTGEREKGCWVGNGNLPKRAIQRGDDANGVWANFVRAEVIRFFAYGGDKDNPVLGSFIRLQGAWISGDLDLTHADIPYALVFHSCHFDGAVQMRHVKCAELDLQGSRLKKGLAGDPLVVDGSVQLSEGFVADEAVVIVGSRIGGDLNCSGGKFCGGLNANRSKIGALVWKNVGGHGYVELRAALAEVLNDDLKSWKPPFKVDLNGFAYGQFIDSENANAKSRIEWLASMPFSPQPYEQVAKVLFGMGHDADARAVLLEKERLQTADNRTPFWRKIGRRLWDEFAGYGYRLRRTVGWTLATIAIGCGVFSHANDVGDIVPHQPAILASAEYQQAREDGFSEAEAALKEFPEHPEFNPLVFSADVFIPLFALHQEPFWYPTSGSKDVAAWLTGDLAKWLDENGPAVGLVVGAIIMAFWFLVALDEWSRRRSRPFWLDEGIRLGLFFACRAPFVLGVYVLALVSPRHWYWIEIGAGWVLTSLLLLSVTGVLRPRQSSGEKG